MNTPAEPEGGKPQNLITTIQVLNNAGHVWRGAQIEHNGKKYLVDNRTGEVRLHINGGAVRINGVTITGKIQKGVENIFQHNSWTGIQKLEQE